MTTSADTLFADVLKAKEAEQANQSSETRTNDTETEQRPADELSLLKARAKTLHITHSPNIGVDTLRAKIQAKLDGEPEPDEKEPAVAQNNPTNVDSAPAKKLTPQQKLMARRKELESEMMKLVRLRITNLNPAKKELPGEIFTVGNRILGTIKKFVPYGEATENGYHVPNWIYLQLKERQFQQIKVTRDSRGREKVVTSMVREFALEELPPLTQKELAQLAAQQAAADGME